MVFFSRQRVVVLSMFVLMVAGATVMNMFSGGGSSRALLGDVANATTATVTDSGEGGGQWVAGAVSLSADLLEDDDVYVSSHINTGFHSYSLRYQGNGFAIPAGATIDGIVMTIHRYATTVAVYDASIRLLDESGNPIGNNKSTAAVWQANSEETVTFGASNDVWGATLTAELINDVDFGIVLMATSPVVQASNFHLVPAAHAAHSQAIAYIDSIDIAVHYTPAIPECAIDDDCDDDNACTVDTCISEVCDNSAGNSGSVCRISAGNCDTAEVCDGVDTACPADAFQTGTECRASAGACDYAETCPGDSADCPLDEKQAPDTECSCDTGWFHS